MSHDSVFNYYGLCAQFIRFVKSIDRRMRIQDYLLTLKMLRQEILLYKMVYVFLFISLFGLENMNEFLTHF